MASYSDHLNGDRAELLNTITNLTNYIFRSEINNQTFTYDALGRPAEVICPVISTTRSVICAHPDNLIESPTPSLRFIGKAIKSEQVANQPFLTRAYGYNLAGNMIWQKYPSGREVTTRYDDVGRVINMESTAESGLDYDYRTTNNNGNIKSQKILDPTTGTRTVLIIAQSYEYDSLNRLLKAQETTGGTLCRIFGRPKHLFLKLRYVGKALLRACKRIHLCCEETVWSYIGREKSHFGCPLFLKSG